MDYYKPILTSDIYPDTPWNDINDFKFLSPLILRREPKALSGRKGGDADYILAAEYKVSYRLDGEPEPRTITVTSGMLTDLASVPWFGRWYVGRVGRHLEACIVHDFLYCAWENIPKYRRRPRDKVFADCMLMAGMEAAKVRWDRRQVVFQMVWWFGGPAFRARRRNRYVVLNPENPE